VLYAFPFSFLFSGGAGWDCPLSHTSGYFRDEVSSYLPGLASNHNSPDLSLPSS
jgi:hypothetical protein